MDRVRVPARINHPTVRMNIWVADVGRPVFSVEARPWRAVERLDAERQIRGAARKLAAARFQAGHAGGEYVWWSEHEANDYLRAEDVPARLLELVEEDITAVVGSGILAGEFAAVLARGGKAAPKAPRK